MFCSKSYSSRTPSNSPFVIGTLASFSMLIACDGASNRSDNSPSTPGPMLTAGDDSTAGVDGNNSDSNEGDGSGSGDSDSNTPSEDSGAENNDSGEDEAAPEGGEENPSEDGGGIRFDVPESDDEDARYCKDREAGIYCSDDRNSYECDADEKASSFKYCRDGVCEEDVGCITCQEGQFSCLGSQVLKCDTSVPGGGWELETNCTANQVCDIKTGTCIAPQVIGTDKPTGVYYKFASLPIIAHSFDADSYDNLLYVTNVSDIHVYELDLLDSDGDGKLEPNQHPENPDNTGPIEERTMVMIDTISLAGAPVPIEPGDGWVENEIYALEDRLYYVAGNRSPKQILEYVFATGTFNVISPPAPFRASQMGYDELRDVFYASGEDQRAVYQYDPASDTWGQAFQYPHLAGAHMDGMEVVTTQSKDSEGRIQYGETYVYVSDMTSDFIGQYRFDPVEGWVQENLFQYNDDTGNSVEGMGFGYLNHFWVAAYGEVYELGGGDLAKYTEPVG